MTPILKFLYGRKSLFALGGICILLSKEANAVPFLQGSLHRASARSQIDQASFANEHAFGFGLGYELDGSYPFRFTLSYLGYRWNESSSVGVLEGRRLGLGVAYRLPFLSVGLGILHLSRVVETLAASEIAYLSNTSEGLYFEVAPTVELFPGWEIFSGLHVDRYREGTTFYSFFLGLRVLINDLPALDHETCCGTP